MDDQKKPRLFIRNPGSGEPWAYCGTMLTGRTEDVLDAERAFGCFVFCEVENDFGGQEGDRFTLEVKRVLMTDAEVAAMPEG